MSGCAFVRITGDTTYIPAGVRGWGGVRDTWLTPGPASAFMLLMAGVSLVRRHVLYRSVGRLCSDCMCLLQSINPLDLAILSVLTDFSISCLFCQKVLDSLSVMYDGKQDLQM
jgi:hypothetical protein